MSFNVESLLSHIRDEVPNYIFSITSSEIIDIRTKLDLLRKAISDKAIEIPEALGLRASEISAITAINKLYCCDETYIEDTLRIATRDQLAVRDVRSSIQDSVRSAVESSIYTLEGVISGQGPTPSAPPPNGCSGMPETKGAAAKLDALRASEMSRPAALAPSPSVGMPKQFVSHPAKMSLPELQIYYKSCGWWKKEQSQWESAQRKYTREPFLTPLVQARLNKEAQQAISDLNIHKLRKALIQGAVINFQKELEKLALCKKDKPLIYFLLYKGGETINVRQSDLLTKSLTGGKIKLQIVNEILMLGCQPNKPMHLTHAINSVNIKIFDLLYQMVELNSGHIDAILKMATPKKTHDMCRAYCKGIVNCCGILGFVTGAAFLGTVTIGSIAGATEAIVSGDNGEVNLYTYMSFKVVAGIAAALAFCLFLCGSFFVFLDISELADDNRDIKYKNKEGPKVAVLMLKKILLKNLSLEPTTDQLRFAADHCHSRVRDALVRNADTSVISTAFARHRLTGAARPTLIGRQQVVPI